MLISTFVSCLALADLMGYTTHFLGRFISKKFSRPLGSDDRPDPGKAVGPQGSPYRNCLGMLGRSGDRGLLGQASTIADRIRADLAQRRNPEQIEKISRSIEPFGR